MKWFAAAALALAACGSTSSPGADGGGGADVPFEERPRYLERLASPADFARVQGEGGEVKYLARAGAKGLPPLDKPCTFQNTALYAGHITFLKSFPELAHVDFDTYLNLTQKNASRVLWGGELKFFSGAIHPRTKVRGVLAYFVYADDAVTEALTPEQLAEVDGRLKGCVPYARDLLVLAAATETQNGHFLGQSQALRGRGIDIIDLRQLQPGGAAEGYSLGEGYGFLRVIPPGRKASDYGPRDVLVTESSSEDLALVAGLVTALPQNLHSHVNLRLREKMIPNGRLPDILQNPVVSLLNGKLVHLTVTMDQVLIEPALLETAMKFWEMQRPRLPPPAADLAQTQLRPLAMLRAADSASVGSKAANLGELSVALPFENTVKAGFAIPFSVYRDFMRDSGQQARLETFLADPRLASDAQFRRAALGSLRQGIEDAALPAAVVTRVAEAARLAFGEAATLPMRFRSSSNVEDGANISGAGLHDSARGCLADDQDGDDRGPSLCLAADERAALVAELGRRQAEADAHPEREWLPAILGDLQKDLSNERAVARAIKKVYASLWNDRAFEERAYWGIDHRLAFMGIAVEPSFVMEKRDTVAVTHLDDGAGGLPLYRLVSQKDGQGVVRPADPTLVAETLTFRRAADGRPTDFRVLARSSLSPQEPLWTEAQLQQLATLLFAAQDHFATKVYTALPRLSLDLEIKLTRDDRIVIKQARPYLQP